MSRTSWLATPWRRQLHSSSRRAQQPLRSVEVASPSSRGNLDIRAFQEKAFLPQKPYLFPIEAGSPASRLPAFSKWFNRSASVHDSHSTLPFASYLVRELQEWPFPYELIRSPGPQDVVSQFQHALMTSSEVTEQIMAGILQSEATDGHGQSFFQLYAPFRLLIKALEFNAARDSTTTHPLHLYIAQSSLHDLPEPLQADLSTPEIVLCAGKGDIYASSIWLGTEPTYTPLHRDPNPNLFCQLYSQKVVRLLPPTFGDELFFDIQRQIRQHGNSRIRTADMMQGQERKALHQAVWKAEKSPEKLHQVELRAGDALFIPEGWWHSVKSLESDGGLNGSVNWWFR
ncbi:Transcription factor jumonji/aspartyl beta-hydroxylase [Metarhizium album ARSEF 1941]|uniref:Transcription factor jumonji/aspartyl beta-hydroxylase n=1 Tax=Metarhizium album (strain ARSEF 1941) TaxID=1081103 RepID=A0A0B2X8P7_METAS|nr:Transcription factor jumonji/aspartyl beta-hydroxylase [Metarhizium album ARSEF 1941]KHO01671.1 Transcription factor jumonji/aspartyl beta-hydroxylase [Metarhizium album ARSEF 1941]